MTGAIGSPADFRWMRMALSLAVRSLGRVAPNPAVGSVLVRDGKVLGRGVTADGGRPHAEALALDQARERYGAKALVGATAYVTLEPCAHYGHTPPCAEALVEAGIARLVCALEDPDPRVSGRGFAAFSSAGIEIEIGVMAADARRLNAGFLSRIKRQRPHLTLKLATTLDGRIATRSGESRWITGPQARARVHLMRAQTDAVLIGAGTARADDPMLDVRGMGAGALQPVRIVADGGLSLPLTGRLATSANRIPLRVLHCANASTGSLAALQAIGAEMIEVEVQDDGLLDLSDALRRISDGGVTRVMCEGGGKLAAALLSGGLVDEIALFTAGKVIGGDGIPGVAALGSEHLAEAPDFALESVETVGDDILSIWRNPAV